LKLLQKKNTMTESELLGTLKWTDTNLGSTLRTLKKEQRITISDDEITLTKGEK